MAKITLKGNAIETCGELPRIGTEAPDFSLLKTDLSEATLQSYSGNKVVLNIFPSIDTPVCATSVKKFNEEIGKLENTEVLCVSADLPFAHKRFCGSEGIESVIPTSTLRSSFGSDYGVTITTGPLEGLLSRAVVVIDEDGDVLYTEQVPEIAQEPDYELALKALV